MNGSVGSLSTNPIIGGFHNRTKSQENLISSEITNNNIIRPHQNNFILSSNASSNSSTNNINPSGGQNNLVGYHHGHHHSQQYVNGSYQNSINGYTNISSGVVSGTNTDVSDKFIIGAKNKLPTNK
jgi:hypothetical protein